MRDIETSRRFIFAFAVLMALAMVFFVAYTSDPSRRGLTSDIRFSTEDTITRERDESGAETAKRKAIEASYEEIIASRDKEISELKKSLSRATAAISEVVIRTTDTIVEQTTETIYVDSLPVYVFNRETELDTFNIIASADSFDIKYSIVNQILLEYRYEKSGLFKKSLVVEAANSNPNTTTDSLVALYIEQSETWKKLSLAAIAAIALVGALIL